jgi:hypothetical protein
VIDLALANEGWGYTRIRDALVQGLKIEIGRGFAAKSLRGSTAEMRHWIAIAPRPTRQNGMRGHSSSGRGVFDVSGGQRTRWK